MVTISACPVMLSFTQISVCSSGTPLTNTRPFCVVRPAAGKAGNDGYAGSRECCHFRCKIAAQRRINFFVEQALGSGLSLPQRDVDCTCLRSRPVAAIGIDRDDLGLLGNCRVEKKILFNPDLAAPIAQSAAPDRSSARMNKESASTDIACSLRLCRCLRACRPRLSAAAPEWP